MPSKTLVLITRFTPLLAVLLLLAVNTAIADGGANFKFNGFRDASPDNLTLTNEAGITSSGLLRLTKEEPPQETGHAFYPRPLRFKSDDSPNSTALSFSTTFVFAIVSSAPNHIGHGIAFVLSPTKNLTSGFPSRTLGIFNVTNFGGNLSSNYHVVAVELDTVQDLDYKDINNNHVGIDINSMVSTNSTPAAYYDDQLGDLRNLTLASGDPTQVWIDYSGPEKKMEVTISPIGVNKPRVPLITLVVDLSDIFMAEMYVGFSSSTGSGTSSHYILGWSFGLNGTAPPLDLNQLPHLPKLRHHMSAAMAVGLSMAAIIVFLLFISAVVFMVRRKRRKFAEVLEDWELEYGPHRFSYKELYRATHGFHEENVVGIGGFGRVYKGVLPSSGIEVAVKKISHDSRQGMREFVAEIASMGRLRHRNLVQLLGYCRRQGEFLLVYDYMVNGSLDRYLFGGGRGVCRPVLNWAQRYHIIKGVAAGLLYLHEGWEQVVVHRDIKASNVLIDGEFNGRLSDFGLARLYDHGGNPTTTRVVGTLGYLAPELIKTGKATTRSDVYAFGNFLLEVACGRMPMAVAANGSAADMPALVDWVLEYWKEGKILKVADPKLQREFAEEEMEKVLQLGLHCSHPEPAARPSMRQVLQFLEGDVPLPEMSPDNLSATSLAFRRTEGFDDFVMSYPLTTDTTFSGGSSSSAKASLLPSV